MGWYSRNKCPPFYPSEYSDVIQIFIPELTNSIIQYTLNAIMRSPLDANIRMAILLKDIPNVKEILERLKYFKRRTNCDSKLYQIFNKESYIQDRIKTVLI